jgi:signal transduction histidine kinase
MQKFKRIFTLITALALIIISFPTFTYAETDQTVTIGFFSGKGYAEQLEDGTYGGADIEYAYKIAQSSGFDIDIKLYDNEKDMLSDLDSGKDDMLFDFGKTSSREKNYLFSENEIGASTLAVYTAENDNRFSYGDIDSLKDKKFGCDIGNNSENVFISWCKSHGFEPNISEYGNIDMLDAAISSGEIDAGISSVGGRKGFSTVINFATQPYYIMLRSDETDLKNKIDSSMTLILMKDSMYTEKLKEKYGLNSAYLQSYTADEQDYINSHSSLNVAVINNDQPYYYADNNISMGIIPEYYSMLSEYTGIEFKFIEYDSNTDALNAVKEGKADILAMFSDGIITAASDGIIETDPYETVDSAMIVKSGTVTSQVKKVAVKQRSVNIVKNAITSMMDAEVVPVTNAPEGFSALKEGKVDAVICGLPTATWILNQTNSTAYTSTVLSNISFDLCGGTAKDNKILASVMNKAINATNYGFDAIIEDNTVQQQSWKTIVSRITPNQIVGISCVFILIILVLIFSLVSTVRGQKEKALVAEVKAKNEKKLLQLAAIEKSNEEKNMFFSNISHDMRTPLNAIIGFIRLARKDDVNPEKKEEYLKKAETSGKLLLDLIDDTLTISKVSSGKLELHPEPVKPSDLFESVSVPIREYAEKKNITFTLDSSDALNRTVMADRLYLQKIMLNLLTNAVKFTQDGGHVLFRIYNEKTDSAEPDSLFEVRDDGIGISEEFLPHIFDPFTQEKRHGYESVGTGLGLSIVKQLVDLMGGTITVKSEKNKGTSFIVRLHFKSASDSLKDIDIPKENTKDIDLKGRKILVCEDNMLNREIAEALLKEEKMIPVSVTNGKEGFDEFESSKKGEFSAILMDIRMPVMDGIEATRKIRSLTREDASSIPIIAMTADAFPEDMQKCVAAGMNAHISKPVDPEKLFGILKNYIKPSER